MSFSKHGLQVVRNLINPQLLKHLTIQFEMLKDVITLSQGEPPGGDHQVPASFAHYAPWAFESLLETVRPEIEKITEKQLHPTYSYARIYYKGAELKRHTDRYSCEYSVTLCVYNDNNPWDIYFEDRNKKEVCFTLNPGDIAVYKGVELPHWRNTYNGNKQIQAFLHYVDANGPYSLFKYDSRPMLGASQDTKKPL